jgi:hypothetical protein
MGTDKTHALNSGSDIFNELLDDLSLLLVERYKDRHFLDSDVDGTKFEKVVFDTLSLLQSTSKKAYSYLTPTLISGNKFPDIVLQIDNDTKFGIEVKTSKGGDWKTLGGSIMESTRVDDVISVSILFAKLNPFTVRHKPFELCVSDVAVTHSPRYLIDLEVSPEKTIFQKIGAGYNEVWKSDKPFDYFRKYFKDKAAKEKTGLWWIEDDTFKSPNDLPTIQIQFFSQLPKERKEYLINKSIILFPNIFSDVADYDQISVWLVNMGILNNSLRDLYSAGEKENVLGFLVPSKFRRLNDRLVSIQNLFKKISLEPSLEEKFGTIDPNKAYQLWVHQIKKASSETNLPFLNALFEEHKFT